MNKINSAILLLVALLFSGCDIRPVSVGVWEVEIDGPDGMQQSVWTITEQRTLSITGQSAFEAEEIELAGSRFSWSSGEGSLLFEGVNELQVNFNGTVDGNRFSGTLFTQLGNFTARGLRQED